MNDPDFLRIGIFYYFVYVFSTVLHEAAHALFAKSLGDSTAYEGGQVTLNPVPHIQREPIGMVVVPLLTYAMNGWMMGWASAPYDPNWALRYPKRAAIMALGGPLANLSLVILSGVLIRLCILAGWYDLPREFTFSMIVDADPQQTGLYNLATILSITFELNLILFVFNLMPLPPLDGSSVVMLGMSEDTGRRWLRFLYEQDAVRFLGILVAWYGFRFVFPYFQLLAFGLLYPGRVWGLD